MTTEETTQTIEAGEEEVSGQEQVQETKPGNETASPEDEAATQTEAPTEETKEEGDAQETESLGEVQDLLKKAYPEQVFETSDQQAGEVQRLIDYEGRNKEANKNLLDIFSKDERLVDTLRDMIDHKLPFEVAIMRHFDQDVFKPMEGDPNYEESEKAHKEFLKKKTEEKQQVEVYETNRKLTETNWKDFTVAAKLTEDQGKDVAAYIDQNLTDIFNGKMSVEFMETMLKGYNYDKDVVAAAEAGQVKGRNEQIDNLKEKEEKKKDGDGTPVIQTSRKTEEKKKADDTGGFLGAVDAHIKKQQQFKQT